MIQYSKGQLDFHSNVSCPPPKKKSVEIVADRRFHERRSVYLKMREKSFNQ